MIEVPACVSSEFKVDANRARQILVPPQSVEITHRHGAHQARLLDSRYVKLVATRRGLGENEIALKAPAEKVRDSNAEFAAGEVSWITKPEPANPATVLDSLEGKFAFREASEDDDRPGLWTPQLGAIYAVLGYWTTEGIDPATVVMPTGTGKTEAMVGLFAARRPECVLVVVPSDALRKQIAGKFELLGVLQGFGVIDADAQRPVVGQLDHRFSSADAARRFCQACNVIVTTPPALLPPSAPEISSAVLDSCSHLFVDEAHHVEARTWRQIRDGFEGKPVLQFTATPFREDGIPLAGRQVYRYPLSVAQAHGYFAQIDYTSIVNFHDPDRALAESAIERLRKDLDAERDHVLMARVKSVSKAEELEELYRELAPDLGPVAIHSRMRVGDRNAALASLHSRETRIVVCVDMLGEGFDLPALKIAAIHDPHKSLGVTLQFVGRFARVGGEDIGTAAVFVGRPDFDFNHGLRRLFAEDADWNQLISDLSENRTRLEEEVSEFESGFGPDPDQISIRSLAPKMSTVVYRTQCADWNPEGILTVHPEETLLSQPLPVNYAAKVAWFVVKVESPVRWGDLPVVEEVSYELFVVYWDQARRLLYINSSNTSSYPDAIATAVAGDTAERIRGIDVYRAMHGIQRLIPTNVGVLDVRDRDRRFTMYAGANVAEGFPTAEAQTKSQTNIFGSGFEDGRRVSIGGSLKGRVWSYAAAQTLKHWVDWCNHVGPKLADEAISVESVIGSFILPEQLENLPDLVPLALEWPIEAALSTSDETRVRLGAESSAVADAELRITEFSKGAPVEFEVRTDDWAAPYRAEIEDGELVYRPAGDEVEIKRGFQVPIPLSEYLTSKSSGPLLLFEQDAVVIQPGILLKPDREQPPYPRNELIVPDWGDGMDIRKESQGWPKNPDSIQARAIRYVCGLDDWDIVLDDDGTGEVADIVAFRKHGTELRVMLTHCKYSSKDDPGARVEDLYDVCGQAQRSTTSRSYPEAMFQKLIRRERNRVTKHRRDGFEVGDIAELYRLQDEFQQLKASFTIAIAQPGLSRQRADANQLQLLAATEVYVREVAKADFKVFCSA
jgi:superfamily II DNA or RNA helicase